MNLIIGGGKYGEHAFQKLHRDNSSIVVLDTSPTCIVQQNHGLPVAPVEQIIDAKELHFGVFFMQGSIAEAAQIVTMLRPERIFPTVPVHVSAGILSELAEFEPEPAGADEIAARIPERFIVGRKGADIYCSQNPDMLCRPDCPEPLVCPVTGERRDVPLWSMLGDSLSGTLPDDAVPRGAEIHQTGRPGRSPGTVIIQSRQCAPGLGYILTSDLFSAFDNVRDEKRVWIGTACKCHGVVTALGKNTI